MKRAQKGLLSSAIVSATLFLGFQNCGNTHFSSSQPSVVDAACNVAEGCASAASTQSTQTTQSQTNSTPTTQSQTNSSPVTQSSNTSQTTNSQPSSPTGSNFHNFVAGDKATCEQSVMQRLGVSATCTISGGCGNCGVPGPSCATANPGLWGVCILH